MVKYKTIDHSFIEIFLNINLNDFHYNLIRMIDIKVKFWLLTIQIH